MTCTDCEHFFKIGYTPPLGKCNEFFRVTGVASASLRSPAELLKTCPLVEMDADKLRKTKMELRSPGRRRCR